MSPATQSKVLRAVEEREIERLGGSSRIPVDARLISATHKDLSEEIVAGRFREDLYYRLRVVTLTLPPLRERPQDIPLLARAFCDRVTASYQIGIKDIAPEAMNLLLKYSWPGNVRELRNVIERSVVLCENQTLEAKDLPDELHRASGRTGPLIDSDDLITISYTTNYDGAKESFERQYLEMVLKRADHNVTRAAEMLGLHRQSLQQKLRRLKISRHYRTED
jgi:DNA-binding NtrC family response regulator